MLVEWWVIWFTLGRNFAATTRMLLGANLVSYGCAWCLIHSGALGPVVDGHAIESDPGGLAAWLFAVLFSWFHLAVLETMVLRLMMRRERRGWLWDNYDLTLVVVANGLSPLLAGMFRLFS